MGFEIIWTKRDLATFDNRIAYLQKNWTEKEIFVLPKEYQNI
ncbi:hypothetical protein GGR35_003715 [Mucilaginibacter phyllosphaerae]|uniref:Uncharacterized protein n=1 Tax=Mucilaginibacter phyllosphaerae TaxID=1812349 RepID=A0ABR6IDF8_9SPHI|nr:hypothetical protein [Mucilaginibacter phyllosphaerae]